MREAAALLLVRGLLEAGAEVQAYDPEARGTFHETLGDPRVRYTESAYEAVEGANALFLCTEWLEFRRPDFERIRLEMSETTIFDGRNLWDPIRLRKLGFTYYGIGRNV